MISIADTIVMAKSFRSLPTMTANPLSNNPIKRLMIFGHPAHELALFGFLQRFRPQIVIITDGGGNERIRQSRTGLQSIGLEATYLKFAENDFYAALLRRDISFFEGVSESLSLEIAASQPDQAPHPGGWRPHRPRQRSGAGLTFRSTC